MTIFIHGGEIITTHGFLRETWAALVDSKPVAMHQPEGFNETLPLGIVDSLDGAFGSTIRLDSLLTKLKQTLGTIPPETALICASTKGAVDEIFEEPDTSKEQIWETAEKLREELLIETPVECVSAACASGTIAIMQGAMKILTGECENVLIVSYDLMSTFVLSGFLSLKALTLSQCRPFDTDRDGVTLGEGGGWLLLSRNPSSFNQTSSTITLENWGISCDSTHITAPCRNGSGLIRTLKQTIAGAAEVGGINGHGTGTVYNDSMELLAFNTLWQSPPPLCSVKGSIGHCLGAAGVIETLISIQSLEKGFVPPTAGLNTPEPTGADFLSGKNCQKLLQPSIITCNSGFGGINGALLLKMR